MRKIFRIHEFCWNRFVSKSYHQCVSQVHFFCNDVTLTRIWCGCSDKITFRKWIIGFENILELRSIFPRILFISLAFANRREPAQIIYIIEHRRLRAHQLLMKKIIFRSFTCAAEVRVCRCEQNIYSKKEWAKHYTQKKIDQYSKFSSDFVSNNNNK